MPKHRVAVFQVFRVEHATIIEVEADDMNSAVEAVDIGEVDLPPYDSKLWTETYELMSEHQEPAP